MKLCVFGAGAIGGHLAARLAAAGHDVSVVARGANLAGIRERGLSLHAGAEVVHGPVRAGDRTDDLGVQDAVFVTTKATALGAFAEAAAPLLGRDTRMVFVQNGIPWWYARGLAANRPAPPDLSRLDPGGRLAGAVAPQQVMGGIVYSSNDIATPGEIHNHTPGRNMLVIGAPDDRAEEDVARLLAEGRAVAQAHGVSVADAPKRPGGAQVAGATMHKPSMLLDYELGRPMEVEAILAAPLAFARSAGVETPLLDMLAAITARMAAAKGLYSHP